MEKYYSLTNRQFALIEPILKEDTRPSWGGKPTISDRHALEAVLYILREGCRWRAMPEVFGHWMMVFMRYKRWVERGVFPGRTGLSLLAAYLLLACSHVFLCMLKEYIKVENLGKS